MLVTSLALQQLKDVGAVTKQYDVTTACTCKFQVFIILALSISIVDLVNFAFLHSQKLKLFRGCLFSNTVKLCYLI